MALKLKIPVKGTVTVKQAPVSNLQAKIDEVGDLQDAAAPILKKIKELNEKLKPYKDAMKELVALVMTDLPGEDDASLEEAGVRYRLEAGAKTKTREITDMAKVRELMGDELFLQCATVKLGDVDAYLTKPQRDTVLETTRGDRGVKIIKKA